jgi:hypothetical protein
MAIVLKELETKTRFGPEITKYLLDVIDNEIIITYEKVSTYYTVSRYMISTTINLNKYRSTIEILSFRAINGVFEKIRQRRRLAVVAKIVTAITSVVVGIPIYKLIDKIEYNNEELSPMAFAKATYRLLEKNRELEALISTITATSSQPSRGLQYH